MGDPIPVALGRGSKKAPFSLQGIAKHKNAYVKDFGDGSKTGFSSMCMFGSELFSTLTNGSGVRAMLEVDNVLLAVAGRTLFKVSVAGVASAVGGITSDGLVTMARNRQTPNPQIAIVCDGQWFIFQGNTLSENPDADLPPPCYVFEHGGYFVFLISDGRWWLVGPDTASVDPLLFAEAEAKPDGLVAGAGRGPDIVLFGTKTTEFWQDTGADDFPYTRGHVENVGCYAAGSVANITLNFQNNLIDSVIWAATDQQGSFAGIYALSGFQATKVSNDEVDALVRAEPDPRNIRAFAWTEDERSFYCIAGTDFSKVFDTKSGEWHDRESYGLTRWRFSCHAQFAGMHIFGHATDNTLAKSSSELGTEMGDPINYLIQTPTIHMWPFRFRMNGLHVDALTGVGLVSTDETNANPKMLIDVSRDGGASWGTPRECELGRAAQFYKRIKERVFGIFDKNGAVLRFQCSAAVSRGIQQIAIDVDKLAA